MKTTFKIEKGIPCPPTKNHIKSMIGDTIARLKKGDSFLVENLSGSKVNNHIIYYGVKFGMKLCYRKEKTEFRVWRVE